MVKFIYNNSLLTLIETPNWVRILDNGSYGLCDFYEAKGVAIDGVVYNLPGHTISDNGEIEFQFIKTGDCILEQTEQVRTDLDLTNIETQQSITDLELKILGG